MEILLKLIGSVYLVGIAAWTTGAIYYDIGRGTRWAQALVAVWILLVIAAVILTDLPMTILLVSLAFAAVLGWWLTQRPSNDRDWAPDFSKLCHVKVDGDHVVVHNVRNVHYRTLNDFDANYETRNYSLCDLKAADVLILFWGSTWMSHPMVIFDFGDDRHLCFSIEVRYQKGQPYDVVRGLYRQYELMYVVSDERDAIVRRTKYSENHDCYLYRLQIDEQAIRQLFEEYVAATNSLIETPRWYNAITDNCTTAILHQRKEKVDLDSRMFFNGTLDQLLYERGRLVNSIPFDELKKVSRINDAANNASAPDFHVAIRKGLPGFDDDLK